MRLTRKILVIIGFIALAFLLVYFFEIQITGRNVSEDKCIDSDGGVVYYIKGTTYGRYGLGTWVNKTDICSYSRLTEYSCAEKGVLMPNFISTTDYICPNGCSNGACLCVEDSECPENYVCKEKECALLQIPEKEEKNETILPTPMPEPKKSFFGAIFDNVKNFFKKVFGR